MLYHLPLSSETHVNKKMFVAADDLLVDSFKLAADIYASGFKPDFLVGLWRGGASVGIAVQEGLDYLGVPTDHIAIRTCYSGVDAYPKMIKSSKPIRVQGLRYLLDRITANQSMLIVDDVYSSGSSVRAVVDKLRRKSRRNLPTDIRIATVWYRPAKCTVRPPDYFVHKTDQWLVLPYELAGLSVAEICKHKPELGPLFRELQSVSARPA
jgi:hypoxanthine phosphoribosyltransferase